MSTRGTKWAALLALMVLTAAAPAEAKEKKLWPAAVTAAALSAVTIAIGAGLIAASASDLEEARALSDEVHASGLRRCLGDPRCDRINELLVDSDNFYNAGVGVVIAGGVLAAGTIALIIQGTTEGTLAGVDAVEIRPVVVARGGGAAIVGRW